MEICNNCDGTGLLHPQQNTDKVCDVCGGSGNVESSLPVERPLIPESADGFLPDPEIHDQSPAA